MKIFIYVATLLLLAVTNVQAQDSRQCSNEQLYLAVMKNAKHSMPEPYIGWTLRGATGEFVSLKPGYCKATLLYLSGDAGGKMTEVDVSIKKEADLAKVDVKPLVSSTLCQPIQFKKGHVAGSVNGEVKPDEKRCYSIAVGANQAAKVSVTSRTGNTAFSIHEVVEAVDSAEFITKKQIYYIDLFQLMPTTNSDSYMLNVEVR